MKKSVLDRIFGRFNVKNKKSEQQSGSFLFHWIFLAIRLSSLSNMGIA